MTVKTNTHASTGLSTIGLDETQEMWSEFGERLRHYIRGRVGTEDDAHDVVQIVFMRIAKHADRLSEIKSRSAWVFQLARNAIADYYRTESATSRTLNRITQQKLIDGEALLLDRDTPKGETLAKCVRPLLKQIPAPYNEAIEMTDLGGLSQKAAAQKLGISSSGMKSRVQRGRAKLKDVFQKCCTVELDGRNGIINFVEKGECGCKISD